jgi:hypothetical protein
VDNGRRLPASSLFEARNHPIVGRPQKAGCAVVEIGLRGAKIAHNLWISTKKRDLGLPSVDI